MKKTFTLKLLPAAALMFALFPFAGMAQPAAGTTGFDTNVGMLATSGLSPQNGNVDGYRFTIYSGNSCEISNLTSQVNLTTTPAGSGVWQFASIESSDGSDFKLQNFHFKVLSAPFIGKNLSVIGYRDGLAVSGAFTISPTITATNTTYTVDVTNVAGFYNIDEFRLQPSGFNAQGTLAIEDITVEIPLILPVKWVSFDVRQGKAEHLLQWLSTVEIDHAYFEVEQSSNGKDFKTVARIQNATAQFGTAQQWNFNYPAGKGVFFYRIRQVDKDGRFQYSGTRKIGGATETAVILFPNPVVTEMRVTGVPVGSRVQVVDATGRGVAAFLLDGTLQVNLAKLLPGRYAIVFDLAGRKEVQWIFKN